MSRVVVYGAGRLGRRVVSLLAAEGRDNIYLVDASEDALDASLSSVPRVVLDGPGALDNFLAEGDILVAAGSAQQCLSLASVALRNRCHYLDFSESREIADSILKLEPNGFSTLLPACGFSPGLQAALITDFTDAIAGEFDLDVYVGIIPAQRTNRLGFGLVMNIDGLLQEYESKARIKRDGEWVEVEPLTLLEEITLSGERFEAFTTGGAANELPNGIDSRARNYAYRTLRYPGHLDYMKFLIDDLKLGVRRYMLSNLLMNGLPPVRSDMAIIHLVARSVTGSCRQESRQRTWRIEGDGTEGGVLYDIAARHSAAIIGLLENGSLVGRGPIRQENCDASLILSMPSIRSLFDMRV